MNRRDRTFHVVGGVYATVLMACAAAAFWPVYGGTAFVVMLAGAVLAGVAVAICGAIWRWSSLVTSLVSAGVFVALGVPLAVPGEALWRVLPTASGLIDLVTSVALGWRQLVTIAVPVGSYQALLVPAYLLTFAGTIVTVTVALRTRMPELALIPPLAVFAFAILLGPDTAATPLPLTVALAGLSVGWLVWMRRRRRVSRLVALASEHADGVRGSERSLAAARSTAIAAGAVVLALAAAVGVSAALVPASARTVARTAATPPFDPRDYPSPLSGFRSYLKPAKANDPMFTVRDVGNLKRIRIATLDSYDGVVYSVGTEPGDSGAFARIPDRLPGDGGTAQTVDVTIDGLDGPWLPTFGPLEHISFGSGSASLSAGFYYNATTGTMADVSALQPGDSYRITAVATPSKTLSQLAKERPGDASQPAIEVMPDDLADALHTFEGDAATPGAKLSSALKRLAETGYISHGIGNEVKSLSGHGADRIDALLTEEPMVGDQEQYAVTAALMARKLGFPARVVLGFDVPQDATGDVTITGSDVSAWIQVQTASDGWVDVDPNPQVRPIPEKKPDEPKKISRPQSVVQPPNDESDADQAPPPQSHLAQQRDAQLPAWLSILLAIATIVGWSLLVLALLCSPFLAVIAAKWRRRRARRSPRILPRGRIAGAWHEFADAAVDHGYSPPSSATRNEVAQTVGGPRPGLLATVADRSAFGLAEPTDRDADQVWRAVDELRRDLDGRTTRWGRLRARISLRSLGGYRGSAHGKGTVLRGGS